MELDEEAPLPEPTTASRVERYSWAMLLARIYDCLPLVCPSCGHAMKILAFVTEGETVRRVLDHVGEPVDPPALSPSRAPPQGELDWDGDQGVEEDFDQQTEFRGEPC